MTTYDSWPHYFKSIILTSLKDGIRAKSRRSPSSLSSSSSSSVSSGTEQKRTAPKVHFRPLSPQSSRVLQQRREASREATSDVTDTADHHTRHHDSRDSRTRTRSSSEPSSSNRLALTRRDRRPRSASPNSSDDDDDVVNLPDRFDPSGRPLDPRDRSRSLHQSHRRPSYGGFEYRPQYPGDVHVRGDWASFPIDGQLDTAVIAQTIGGLLQGQGGILGTLGHLLQDGARR